MDCEEMQPLIEGYVDGELDLERNLRLERHLATCAACESEKQGKLELRTALRTELPYFRAPRDLQQRVRAIARQQDRAAPRSSVLTWRWMGAAAAMLLVVSLAAMLERNWLSASSEQAVAQEVVAGHIRSLMANHLSDVASTDQHTVKPWFDGKLDFAPPVVDLAAEGFPLVGGRLDYAERRPVAALVYRRRLHYINLFVWPSSERASAPIGLQTRDGYNVLHWTRDGMTFWAVSDITGDDLQTFVGLLRK